MENINFEQIWPGLLCLLPVYTREGNGTEILLEHREPLYSRYKTKTLVRQLARYFMVDMKEAQRKYAAICGRSYAVPLPLRPDFILVPVRARSALVKDDGTRAYVVQSKIAEVITAAGDNREQQTRTRLVFTGGGHLDVPQRMASLRSLLTQARLIEKEALRLSARPGLACVRENAPVGCLFGAWPGTAPWPHRLK